MKRSVDVAIIGAGQAGLATSWHLSQAKVDHVVLEAGRVAETWRTRRWDSFCLVTPNWSVLLPGANYDGPDPDGYMPLAELVDYFQSWANSFDAPVEEVSPVTSLEADDGGFLLSLPSGALPNTALRLCRHSPFRKVQPGRCATISRSPSTRVAATGNSIPAKKPRMNAG